jgi:hypothetical protein
MNREEAREKALDIAKERELIGVVSPELAWNIGFSSGFDAGQANQWVRIEDGKPESGKTYDVTFYLQNNNIGTRSRLRTATAYFMNGDWRVSEYESYVQFTGTVTAYRERPEPYQENNNAG